MIFQHETEDLNGKRVRDDVHINGAAVHGWRATSAVLAITIAGAALWLPARTCRLFTGRWPRWYVPKSALKTIIAEDVMRQPESDNPRVYSDELHRLSWDEYGLLVLAEKEKQETRRNARRLVWRALFCVGLLAAVAGLMIRFAPLVMGG